jgi:hypothetical protein
MICRVDLAKGTYREFLQYRSMNRRNTLNNRNRYRGVPVHACGVRSTRKAPYSLEGYSDVVRVLVLRNIFRVLQVYILRILQMSSGTGVFIF